MIHLKTILQPTDFSEASRYALELACGLARDQGARVLLLHVLPRPVGEPGQDVSALKSAHAEEDLKAYREEMAGLLSRACETALCANVQPVLNEGPVAEVIARTASDRPCDLIVMGTDGRSGARGTEMGSVAAAVARSVSCPVVMVKPPPR